ncbi:hypothetical protein C5167_013546 [Papaver somniferum]|uniref:Radical SAM core domain-containing protein n=1 Tax=Papaver somniferum TaxID=3469 RepID=A0A4Y7J0M9_PAPSO|nr:hypothetical protein C5167_013546 [Papaver somniferum]
MAFKSIFDSAALRTELEKAGINTSFIPQIWKYVIKNPNCKFDEIPSLPSALYPLLQSKFKTSTSTVDTVLESLDNVTTKLLVKLQNGAFVEAVIMRYDSRLGMCGGKPRPGGVRATLCVSSQVGCKMACTFCATGSMGFKNHLSSGEIVEQLVHASRLCEIRNIVFMGMGEPLNNYTNVVEAVRSMIGYPFSDITKENYCINCRYYGLNLVSFIFHSDVTIIPCYWLVGIIPAIKKLHDDLPSVNLAVSLHAPDQKLRCQIMPTAASFSLDKLMDSLHVFQQKSQQKIFIEYIMLEGVNDGEQQAHDLSKLLEKFQVVINLIPFNPIGSLSKFSTSTDEGVVKFQQILRGTCNIRTTIRKQMGQDIMGACGQLVVSLPAIGSSSITDIEDLLIRV